MTTTFVRGGLGTFFAMFIVAACDKSTSGGHREADLEEVDTGGNTTGGSPSRGGTSTGGTSVRGGADSGGTDAGGTGTGGTATGGSGGGPVLPPCLECAATECAESVLACDAACEPLVACLIACADTDAACENACLGASDDARVTAVTSCMREECADVCGWGGDLTEAAARQAEIDCSMFESCALPLFAYNYGELATCVERATTIIEWLGALEDSGVTPAALDACADEISESTCEQYLSARNPRIGCIHPGKRGVGEPCRNGVQCASGFCPSVGFACSTCAPMPHEGDPCSKPEDCTAGLVCSASGGATGVCAIAARVGEACGAANPCDSYLDCSNGTCAAQQTVVGSACGSTPSVTNCDAREGLTCTSTTSGTCNRFTTVPLNAACGSSMDEYQICSALGQCVNGRCTAGVEVGGTCGASGPFCMWPEQCIGSRCVGPPSDSACSAQVEVE
jgi:hypothetical protein